MTQTQSGRGAHRVSCSMKVMSCCWTGGVSPLARQLISSCFGMKVVKASKQDLFDQCPLCAQRTTMTFMRTRGILLLAFSDPDRHDISPQHALRKFTCRRQCLQ